MQLDKYLLSTAYKYLQGVNTSKCTHRETKTRRDRHTHIEKQAQTDPLADRHRHTVADSQKHT